MNEDYNFYMYNYYDNIGLIPSDCCNGGGNSEKDKEQDQNINLNKEDIVLLKKLLKENTTNDEERQKQLDANDAIDKEQQAQIDSNTTIITNIKDNMYDIDVDGTALVFSKDKD